MSILIFALLLFQSIANIHFIMTSCILTSPNHPSVYLTMFGSDFIAEVKFDEQIRIYFYFFLNCLNCQWWIRKETKMKLSKIHTVSTFLQLISHICHLVSYKSFKLRDYLVFCVWVYTYIKHIKRNGYGYVYYDREERKLFMVSWCRSLLNIGLFAVISCNTFCFLRRFHSYSK